MEEIKFLCFTNDEIDVFAGLLDTFHTLKITLILSRQPCKTCEHPLLAQKTSQDSKKLRGSFLFEQTALFIFSHPSCILIRYNVDHSSELIHTRTKSLRNKRTFGELSHSEGDIFKLISLLFEVNPFEGVIKLIDWNKC